MPRRKLKASGKVSDVYGIKNAVSRIASVQGLSLREKAGLVTPYTDMIKKVIYVPPLDAYAEPGAIKLWLGYVYHEVGHHHPDLQDLLEIRKEKKIDPEGSLSRTLNCLEDIRNDRQWAEDYPGARQVISFLQGYHIVEADERLKAEGFPEGPEPELFAGTLGLSYQFRSETFQKELHAPVQSLLTNHPQFSNLLRFLPDLREMRTGQDVYDLACKIVDEEEGEGSSAAQENSPGYEGEGEERKGSVGDMSKDEDGNERARDMARKFSPHNHDPKENTDRSDDLQKQFDVPEGAGDWKPHENQIVMKAGEDEPIEYIVDHIGRGSKLSSACRRLLQSKMQTLKTYNHLSGKLSRRDLPRVLNQEFDVFNRYKPQVDPRGTAVYILMDASGSMAGHKFNVAAASCVLLSEALTPLGIPNYTACFTERGYDSNYTYVVKSWNERPSRDTLVRRFSWVNNYLHQNADGESVLTAYRELMSRQEPRKVLIVLSDGQPASDLSHRYNVPQHLRDVIAMVSKSVECYGIGINSNAVQDYYPEYTVLEDASELQAKLFEVVKTKVIHTV